MAAPTPAASETGPTLPSLASSPDSRIRAPRIAGTDSRKQNRAASARPAPNNSSATRVAPLREMPGKMAIPCATPVRSATGSEMAVGPAKGLDSGSEAV